MTLHLQWWEYCLMALSFFIGCVFINFLVKKMNETKLEERLSRLQHKRSTNHSTQVQESSTMEPLTSDTDQLSYKGISFVYNKEENLKTKDGEHSNISSNESTKQNSKLKFLGKIYDDIKISSNENHKNKLTNGYNYETLTKNKSNQLSEYNFTQNKPDLQNNVELETWISELLMNYIMANWRSF